MHGADVDRCGVGGALDGARGERRGGSDVPKWLGGKLRPAFLAAKEVSAISVLVPMRRLLADGHTAHQVLCRGGRRLLRILMNVMGSLVVGHVCVSKATLQTCPGLSRS